MHYFNFHIGDYISHTLHLSAEEDLAYRRLLDMYYDSEQPIPNNIPLVSRRLRMGSEVVESVLKEFFELTEKGYTNRRADLEIREYQGFIEKQRNNGRLGGRPKKTQRKPTANPDITQKKPNQEPITNNHKPNNKATIVASPDGVSLEVWESFVKQRKAKRAQITDLVIEGIQREANKAGWSLEDALREIVVRNWQSFKADWVKDKQTHADRLSNTMSVLTNGLTTPKKPFWQTEETEDVKRIL